MRNFVVTIDGKSYSVGVEEVGESDSVAPVVTKIEKASPAAPAKAVSANGEKVLSPFPGLIKKILVNDGDTVKKDQPIIVLEAMKMDTPVVAPCDGVVNYSASEGNNVDTGAVLCTIA